MGLFRRKSFQLNGSSSSSTWVNTTNRNDITQHSQDSDKKREFYNSLTSLESMTVGEGTRTSSLQSNPTPQQCSNNSKHDDVGAPSQRVQLLEWQLQQKDKIISRLHQTMDALEKVQSERIYLLERQLEQLVELSSSYCAACQVCKASSLELNLANKNKLHRVTIDDVSHHKGIQEHREAKIEISTLQELLSRVVAEKDRLVLKNDNLMSMLDECRSSSDACFSSKSHAGSNMPSSIEKLDSMINRKERKTKRRWDINKYRQDQLELNNELRQGDYSSNDIHHIQKESKNNERSPPILSVEKHPVLYKMSCRNSPTDQSNVDYVGNFSTASNNTTQELTMIVTHHFSQVWKMILQQQGDGSISSGIHNGNGLNQERSNESSGIDSGSFSSSSMARHLVTKECRKFSQEEEVLEWCMKNIKVEIKEHIGNQTSSREKKKRQSKSRKKHQNRGENRGSS